MMSVRLFPGFKRMRWGKGFPRIQTKRYCSALLPITNHKVAGLDSNQGEGLRFRRQDFDKVEHSKDFRISYHALTHTIDYFTIITISNVACTEYSNETLADLEVRSVAQRLSLLRTRDTTCILPPCLPSPTRTTKRRKS